MQLDAQYEYELDKPSELTSGDNRMKYEFSVGDKVYKPTGYAFPGEVRATFTNTNGECRYVVELADNGMLHIFTGKQLKHVEDANYEHG